MKMKTRSATNTCNISKKRGSFGLAQPAAAASGSRSVASGRQPKRKVNNNNPTDENDIDISGSKYQLRKRKSSTPNNTSAAETECPPKKRTSSFTKPSTPESKVIPNQSKIPDLFAKQRKVLRERTNQEPKISFTAIKPSVNLGKTPNDEPAPVLPKLPPWKRLPPEQNTPSKTEDVYTFVPDVNEPKVVKKKRKCVRKKLSNKSKKPFKSSAAVCEATRSTRSQPASKHVNFNEETKKKPAEDVSKAAGKAEPSSAAVCEAPARKHVSFREETMEEPAENLPTACRTADPQPEQILSGSFVHSSLRMSLERLDLNDAQETHKLEESFLKLPQDEELLTSARKIHSNSRSSLEETYSELLHFDMSISPVPLDKDNASLNVLSEMDRTTSTPRSTKTPSITENAPASPIAFPDTETLDKSTLENEENEPNAQELMQNCFGFDSSSSPNENTSLQNASKATRASCSSSAIADESQAKPLRMPLLPLLETLKAGLAKPSFQSSNKRRLQQEQEEAKEKIRDSQANRVASTSPERTFVQPPRRSYEGRFCKRQLLRCSDTERESEDEEAKEESKKKVAKNKKRTKKSSKAKQKSKQNKELDEWASRINSHFQDIENVKL